MILGTWPCLIPACQHYVLFKYKYCPKLSWNSALSSALNNMEIRPSPASNHHSTIGIISQFPLKNFSHCTHPTRHLCSVRCHRANFCFVFQNWSQLSRRLSFLTEERGRGRHGWEGGLGGEGTGQIKIKVPLLLEIFYVFLLWRRAHRSQMEIEIFLFIFIEGKACQIFDWVLTSIVRDSFS